MDASYCVCKSGVSDSVLQKNIDYACGNGADCAAIHQNGTCYNPNTVKDHCSYAVNSYYQKQGNAPSSCDYGGTVTVTSNPPNVSSSCVYPSGAK
ncbi:PLASMODESMATA CALLOSE-BINDING PROTEIN 2-like isoform X2 [Salvia hispanica]|uniref:PLASMODESMATA CALLOSE-BINDING PROTEIN 2-like isoform X2 n=1 Tax=Salvia hispanica TaxID=49212 RepID=UPI002009D829|nr:PLASMODESMATA CALLOSE-BINDING PROTEIN 2-like isoform X2 [Salvia hispanica]